MAFYGRPMWAMSKLTSSVRKLSWVPKVIGRWICPRELEEPPPTPEQGLLCRSRSSGTWRRLKASIESMLRLAPPSMGVLVMATWQMVGMKIIGSAAEQAVLTG